ncbi:phage portal protein [Clostridium magnum]|uniref:Phage portal protein n=3 Tax=Clostridium magnum TaxID=33954 RepID=A0A162UWL2_9CLOT|nr:phage portal protein [Clostridium magnum]KZL94360.1 phage portal protein [Clostridium magnum DSM 2767]
MVKERRSLFSMIFGNNKPRQPTGQATQLKMMNGYMPIFSQFGNEAYASDVVRAAVDAIARNAAKLQPKHMRRNFKDGTVSLVDDNLQYLLSVQPNPFMNAYMFRYKVITQLYMQNNAFIYIRLDSKGNIKGFYPINASNTEFLEYNGEIFARFTFMGGDYITVPYVQLIHLRRFFYKDDIFGETNDYALYPTLELIHTTDQGIVNAIKTSAFIRGILKFTQILKRQDKKDRTKDFMDDYMNINNNGGVASVDGSMDYIDLKADPKIVNMPQMDFIEQKVYKYFGISKEIVTSNYTEQQWNAFYESILEPIGIQMGQEFTSKSFTGKEQGFGNEIMFEANRLQYASNATKVAVGTFLTNIGAASLDQILDMFNMPTIGGEEGSRRVQTLNMVNAKLADQYQTGNEGGDKGDGTQTTGN